MMQLLAPATARMVGDWVYIYGVDPAKIIEPDREGAVVERHFSGNLEWFEWDRLSDQPAPPLRFRIRKPYNEPGFANWYVTGNRPDSSGDYTWAHFQTHAEAVAYVQSALALEP